MLAIVPETGREVNGGCESAQKGEKKSPLFWGRGGWERLFPALLERAGTRASQVGGRCGISPAPLERQGTLACPAGAPFLGKKWGKEPPGEEVPPPGPPSLVGGVGEAVLLSCYLACGPHSERPVTARPPAGRAGDVGGYPLGEGREEPFGFPLSPPVNKPLFPPARAGGRAMRRWSLRPQARYADRKPTPLLQQSREKGCGGKKLFPPRGSRGQSPLVFFPLFLQRNRAPPGRAPFPPVPTAKERNRKPPVRASPAQTAPPPAPRTAGRRDG